jgi:acid phosphatase (class A)
MGAPMRKSLLLAVVAAIGLTAPAQAQDVAKPKPALMLAAAEIDPARLLPPPPAEGSFTAKAEMAELHAIETARSADVLAHAKSDDVTKDASIFAGPMGPGFDLAKLPATTKLMGDVRREEKAAADKAKAFFQRKRPWIVDPSLQSCSRDDEPLSAYPSGHATMGYSMALVLADIAPEKAQALLARAQDYANSRLVCGMHLRTDIVAGQVLGTAVALDLLHNVPFQADRDAALAELRAAGLIH